MLELFTKIIDAINALADSINNLAKANGGTSTTTAVVETPSTPTPLKPGDVPNGAEVCPKCKGRKLWRKKPCPECNGEGFVMSEETEDDDGFEETEETDGTEETEDDWEETEEEETVTLEDLQKFGAENFRGNKPALDKARKFMKKHLKEGETKPIVANLREDSYADAMAYFQKVAK